MNLRQSIYLRFHKTKQRLNLLKLVNEEININNDFQTASNHSVGLTLLLVHTLRWAKKVSFL